MPVNVAMHRLTMLLTAVALLPMPRAIASACDCETPPDPATALAHSTAVFEGTVDHVDRSEHSAVVHFAVSRAWKGVRKEHVSASINTAQEHCLVPFVEGQSYVVYATGGSPTSNPPEPVLTIATCGRTKRTLDAQEDLAVLGMGAVPVDASKEVERTQPAEVPPQRTGCASCQVGGLHHAAVIWPLATALLALTRLRRRLWTRRT